MTSILGLDISSTQLNGCLLVDGQAPVLRVETLGKATEPLIERLRRVARRTHTLCVTDWNYARPGDTTYIVRPPDWVVIEQPAGKYGLQALLPLLGAITASVPSESQVAWRKASEWRTDLGAKNTKTAGHSVVRQRLIFDYAISPSEFARELDEHELDAIGIALAWQRILASQATPAKASTTRGAGSLGDT